MLLFYAHLMTILCTTLRQTMDFIIPPGAMPGMSLWVMAPNQKVGSGCYTEQYFEILKAVCSCYYAWCLKERHVPYFTCFVSVFAYSIACKMQQMQSEARMLNCVVQLCTITSQTNHIPTCDRYDRRNLSSKYLPATCPANASLFSTSCDFASSSSCA